MPNGTDFPPPKPKAAGWPLSFYPDFYCNSDQFRAKPNPRISRVKRVLESISWYKGILLPSLIHRSGASLEMIKEFRTEVFVKPSKQMAVQGYLKDDRGREYVCDVFEF